MTTTQIATHLRQPTFGEHLSQLWNRRKRISFVLDPPHQFCFSPLERESEFRDEKFETWICLFGGPGYSGCCCSSSISARRANQSVSRITVIESHPYVFFQSHSYFWLAIPSSWPRLQIRSVIKWAEKTLASKLHDFWNNRGWPKGFNEDREQENLCQRIPNQHFQSESLKEAF
jgi:hypothetical protein